MNTKKMVVVVLILSINLLFSACARLGPNMISKDVYTSSRDVVVAENQTRITSAEANKLNKKLEQERAKEWQKVAIAEIQGKTTDNDKIGEKTISAEGVLGGFPCIFINDSRRNKNLTIQKVGGFLDGKKWNWDLVKSGGIKKYKLPDGHYIYWWTTDYSSKKYGPGSFTVTTTPHYYYDKIGKNFHGGVRLY